MFRRFQSTIMFLLYLFTAASVRAAAPACTNTTTSLISKATTGGAGDHDSGPEEITADGRYVAFRSTATNLVSPPIPFAAHVYIRDRVNGTLAMLDDVNAGQGFNNQVDTFKFSGDGHALAFATLASNVIPSGDTNGAVDVYVKDFRNGTYVRASVPDPSVTAAHGVTQSAQSAISPAVNGDGRYIAFISSGTVFSADNYDGQDFTSFPQIYVRDSTGLHTYLASRTFDAHGNVVTLNGSLGQPLLTSDGLMLAFTSNSTNIAGFANPTGRRDVYLAQFANGVWTINERIDAGPSGIDESRKNDLSISSDGHYVAFVANGSDATRGELYVYDRTAHTTSYPLALGTRTSGTWASGPRLGTKGIAWNDSYDVNGEGGGGSFWYLFPTTAFPSGVLQRIGREPNGHMAGNVNYVALSGDGNWAAFNSNDELVPPDTANYDVFLQRMTPTPDFTYNCTGLSCSFDASLSTAACAISSYAWDFGDGTTGSGSVTAHTYVSAGERNVTLTIVDANGVPSSIVKPLVAATASSFVAVTPCRIWDTRKSTAVVSNNELIVNAVNPVQQSGYPLCGPYPNARAVSVNITAISPGGPGYVEAYATGSPSVTAALTFAPATSPRGNNTIVPVAADGTIALKPVLSPNLTVDLAVDLDGYFTDAPAQNVTPLGFQTVTPCRAYNSRLNNGQPFQQGETRNLTLQNQCTIPVGAAAVSLNASVVFPTAQGYLTLYPSGMSAPTVATVIYPAEPTTATTNGARVKLASGTPDLAATMMVFGGTAHLTLDVNGYFKSDAPLHYTPLNPCRALDTRIFTQGPALGANDTRTVSIRGLCGVPADAKAVMMNLTVINPGGTGYVTAYPSGIPLPGVATIVFAANEPAQGNGSIVPLAASGSNELSLFAFLPAQTHTDVAIDVFGFFR